MYRISYIQDLKNLDAEENVFIFGSVIDKDGDLLLVDDGTGAIYVDIKKIDNKNIELGINIAIIGRSIRDEESFYIVARMISKMESFDLVLYKNLKEELLCD